MADIATTALQAAIDGWSEALEADSANPQPTVTLDGKTVSNAEWREKLLANIKEAQDAINQRNPKIVWTGCQARGYPWGGWG